MSGGMLETTSGVSAFDGKAFVVFRWEGQSGQASPSEARATALHILACADAAESDAAVVKRLRASGYDTAEVVAFLKDVRDLRSIS